MLDARRVRRLRAGAVRYGCIQGYASATMAARYQRPAPWPMLLIGVVLLVLLAAAIAIVGLPLVLDGETVPVPPAPVRPPAPGVQG